MDELTELIEFYLKETSPGGVEFFHRQMRNVSDCRVGQAFFNSLNSYDQYRLRGTLVDPFYHSSLVGKALEFLIDH